MSVYLLEVDAYNADTPGVETLRFSSGNGYTTEPDDSPANTFYEPRLSVPLNIKRTLFKDGRTSGVGTVDAGTIRLANPDGELDYLQDRGLDGRAIVLRALASEDSAFSSATVIFTGTIEQVEFAWTTVTLRARDRLAEIDVPIQETLFAGTTTSSSDEAEGRPEDLKDQPLPLVFGQVFNIKPAFANIYDLIFKANDGAVEQIDVYDGGVPLTNDGDYASLAALRAATITAGYYATCLAEGLFRLESLPAREVTCDVIEGATSADRSASAIVERILTDRGGLTTGDVDLVSFAALHTANAAVVGIFVSSETSILAVCGEVLDSIGGFLAVDRNGQFFVGRYEPGAGTPLLTLTTTEILADQGGGIRRQSLKDEGSGVPAWRVTIEYQRNYTVQLEGELGGDKTSPSDPVGLDHRQFVEKETRSESAEDASVKTKHLLAPALTFTTLLTTEADAATEAARRLAIYKVETDRYLVRIRPDASDAILSMAMAADLNDVLEIDVPRFGLDGGALARTIGATDNLETNVREFDVVVERS